jgi:DNA-binding SARP family transcriptional activator
MDDKSRLTQLLLLSGFRLIYRGGPLRFGASSERLLALLAMRRCPAFRRSVTRELRPEQDEKRAAGNLRSVIWRLPAGLLRQQVII